MNLAARHPSIFANFDAPSAAIPQVALRGEFWERVTPLIQRDAFQNALMALAADPACPDCHGTGLVECVDLVSYGSTQVRMTSEDACDCTMRSTGSFLAALDAQRACDGTEVSNG
jgi:hypothetical protein